MVNTEIWKPIYFFDGAYEVSNMGRVRRAKPGRNTYVGRICKPWISRHGYLLVILSWNGVRFQILVSDLVANAFLGRRKRGKQVNHINGNKADNRDSNLEYMTAKENVRHAFSLGLRGIGEKSNHVKLSAQQVKEVRMVLASCPYGQKFAEYQRLGTKFGVSASCIGAVARRTNWKEAA